MAKICGPDYRYGKWAGDPAGRPQNPTHCVEEIHPAESAARLARQLLALAEGKL